MPIPTTVTGSATRTDSATVTATETEPDTPTPGATASPPDQTTRRPRPVRTLSAEDRLRVVAWVDPVADPHGLHPCSRYVELYWLGIIGPSTTWLLRRLSYGLEIHPDGFDLDLADTAAALGLGDRMGKNSPFRRALQRLCTFELARPHGPGGLAVRTRIPPLPLRHLSRLPASLQASHRRWAAEQRLPEPEQMRRRAHRLAASLASVGHSQTEIERQLGTWQFHPAVAYQAADRAVAHQAVAHQAAYQAADRAVRPVQPGSSSWPAGVRPQ